MDVPLCDTKCVNETDFLSLADLKELPENELFCFRDEKGFRYGFDVKSFNNLIKDPVN